jgi:hypothetical protein
VMWYVVEDTLCYGILALDSRAFAGTKLIISGRALFSTIKSGECTPQATVLTRVVISFRCN